MNHLMDSEEALEDVRWAEPGNEGEIRVELSVPLPWWRGSGRSIARC